MDPHDRGFTLVEVVIAIVLVGILSAVVVVGVGQLTTRGTTAACTTSADAARAAATTHLGTTGTYPTTFTQMTSATPPALTLPTGATIDATGRLATVGSWTLTLTPGTSGQPPRFSCNVPTGFSVGPTGNYYRFISSSVEWPQASTLAATYSANGNTGHLATITSAAEQTFVFGLVGPTSFAWLGARSDPGTTTFRWRGGPEDNRTFWQGPGVAAGGVAVDGAYTNWNAAGLEPNGGAGTWCVHIFANTGGGWNDQPCNWTSGQGFVVEIAG